MREIFKQLNLSNFVVIDFETTGLNPTQDSVIEFSGIRFIDEEPKEILSFLCDPGFEIPSEIEMLTGISNGMVAGEMPFEKRLKEVMAFIDDSPIVGHNIGFDLSFLKEYLRKAKHIKKKNILNPLYDTSLLAQAFFFYLHNHKLTTVSEYCGFSSRGSHRAEVDALNTGRLFIRLIQEVMKYDLETLQTINRILEGTNDPNKWLYRNLSERLILSRSIGDKRPPVIDWKAHHNIVGKRIEPSEDNLFQYHSSKEIADQYFGKAGFVSTKLKNFEIRPQQKKMAENVIDCLLSGESALIEAGTGVGKTLAYLIPAILYLKGSSKEEQRVVTASNTKTLQDQIFNKEIPFIQHNMKINFKAVLLKGRNNYICLTKWNRLFSDIENTLHIANRSCIIPIVIWLKHTLTGDISENNGFKIAANYQIWNEICSEPGYCTTSICQKYDGCYLGKIRHHAATANIIVVNHSLLLADSAAENAILPEYSVLIVDEAHNLEKNSYNYYASRVSLPAVIYILNNIYTGTTNERGLLINTANFARQIKKYHEIELYIDKIKDNVSDLKITAEAFFRKILSEKSNDRNNNSRNYGIKKRYKVFNDDFPNFDTEVSTFTLEINNLLEKLIALNNKMINLTVDFPNLYDELRTNLNNIISKIDEYRTTFQKVTEGNDEQLIFWYEIGANGKEMNVEIACTPLDVSKEIYSKILKKLNSAILTSATLRIADSFEYLKQRTGIGILEKEAVKTVAVGSPFRYSEQMRFFTYLHDCEAKASAPIICSLLVRLARETNRGIMVLFTNYSSLGEVYKQIAPTFKSLGISLLAQGHGGSRTAILEQFRAERNSVLLGTDSFWEGVDIIGESLEILVITKLPFPVPSEPIIEANVEKYKKEGKNSFNEYYVPEAVLKFRQGIGRLIRSSSDIGVVINLDNRIDSMNYGNYFKEYIPVTPETVVGENRLIESVKQFFSGKKSLKV